MDESETEYRKSKYSFHNPLYTSYAGFLRNQSKPSLKKVKQVFRALYGIKTASKQLLLVSSSPNRLQIALLVANIDNSKVQLDRNSWVLVEERLNDPKTILPVWVRLTPPDVFLMLLRVTRHSGRHPKPCETITRAQSVGFPNWRLAV